MKPAWLVELEQGFAQLRDELKRRRAISTVDPVADGISYAVSEFETRVATITAPGRELTPAEWGAEQSPPVTQQTVRNWIIAGELEARSTAHGYRILASAVRVRRGDAAS